MSDVEVDTNEQTQQPKPGLSVNDVNEALRTVLKNAMINHGLARGLKEAAKAIDCRKAHLAVLNEKCDEPAYVKLIESLCAQHQVDLIKVSDPKVLGEMAGLCQYDRDGLPRKVVGCSAVAVTDFGAESQAFDVLREYFGKR